MSLEDQFADIPVQCGVGRMRIAKFHFPIPVVMINFGAHAEAHTERFLGYKNITLSITEINKFLYAYTIHSEKLFCKATDGTVGHEAEGGAHEHEIYEFSMTHNVQLKNHKLFVGARVACEGQWVLLVRTNVVLFLLMNAHGDILRQEIRPLENIVGTDWKDPPLA